MVSMRTVSSVKRAKLGDRAVDGLLAGMGAGLAMIAFLILVGWMFGESPRAVLLRFALGGGALRGVLLHMAVSGIYGLMFGLIAHASGYLRDWIKSPLLAMLAGLIYGSFLWLLSGMVLLSVDVSPFDSFPQPAFAIAHLIYGVALGALAQRQAAGNA
jgi:hypothetical protein